MADACFGRLIRWRSRSCQAIPAGAMLRTVLPGTPQRRWFGDRARSAMRSARGYRMQQCYTLDGKERLACPVCQAVASAAPGARGPKGNPRAFGRALSKVYPAWPDSRRHKSTTSHRTRMSLPLPLCFSKTHVVQLLLPFLPLSSGISYICRTQKSQPIL